MQVVAFSTPRDPEWRWRIVDYDGHTVQESYQTFPSIAAAVTDGATRLDKMNVESTSHTRSR